MHHANIENAHVIFNRVYLAVIDSGCALQGSIWIFSFASYSYWLFHQVFWNPGSILRCVAEFGWRSLTCIDDRVLVRLGKISFESSLSRICLYWTGWFWVSWILMGNLESEGRRWHTSRCYFHGQPRWRQIVGFRCKQYPSDRRCWDETRSGFLHLKGPVGKIWLARSITS